MHVIKREIAEELTIEPPEFKHLWFNDYYSNFERTIIRTWFFVSDISIVWPKHKLTEGQDVDIFRFEQLTGLAIPPVMRQTILKFHEAANGFGLKANGIRQK